MQSRGISEETTRKYKLTTIPEKDNILVFPFFDENGVWGKTQSELFPTKESFLKGTPFCHAACMVRKGAYEKVKGYSISNRLLR